MCFLSPFWPPIRPPEVWISLCDRALLKNDVSYTIKKNRKSRIGYPKNGIEATSYKDENHKDETPQRKSSSFVSCAALVRTSSAPLGQPFLSVMIQHIIILFSESRESQPSVQNIAPSCQRTGRRTHPICWRTSFWGAYDQRRSTPPTSRLTMTTPPCTRRRLISTTCWSPPSRPWKRRGSRPLIKSGSAFVDLAAARTSHTGQCDPAYFSPQQLHAIVVPVLITNDIDGAACETKADKMPMMWGSPRARSSEKSSYDPRLLKHWEWLVVLQGRRTVVSD